MSPIISSGGLDFVSVVSALMLLIGPALVIRMVHRSCRVSMPSREKTADPSSLRIDKHTHSE